jgi:hypothetical protein
VKRLCRNGDTDGVDVGNCGLNPSNRLLTPEGLERSRQANWKHGHYSRKPRRNGRAFGRQYLRSATCAA